MKASGEIVEFNGEESLPYVLGPLGQLFIEPLDPYGEPTWSSEYTTSLRIVKREANDPLSRARSRMRMPFNRRGRFNPFGEEPEEETIKVIPAVERTSYRLGAELNNRITIHKKYEFTTTSSPKRPYLSVAGSGEIVFDRKLGMPASLDYRATITQNDEDGSVDKLPITLSYTLRDPEVVKKERAAARQRAEEQRKREQEERTKPNPKLVDELLASIRRAEGGHGALQHLQRLARIAVVSEKRDAVLKVARNHRSNSNAFIQGSAAEIFCKWSTEDDIDEMWNIVFDKNHMLNNARKVAIARLVEFNQPGLYPKLIRLMNNISMRHDLKKKLIAAGPVVEEPVLESFDSVKDAGVRRDLVEVLQKVGTEKSISMLEGLATGSDFSMKFPARRALDAIRARL